MRSKKQILKCIPIQLYRPDALSIYLDAQSRRSCSCFLPFIFNAYTDQTLNLCTHLSIYLSILCKSMFILSAFSFDLSRIIFHFSHMFLFPSIHFGCLTAQVQNYQKMNFSTSCLTWLLNIRAEKQLWQKSNQERTPETVFGYNKC